MEASSCSTVSISPAVGTALCWGAVAVTRSPSATLGILSQTRAAGALASFTLAFVMLSDIVVVVLIALVLAIARPLIEGSGGFSSERLVALGHDLFGSVAIGTTLGIFGPGKSGTGTRFRHRHALQLARTWLTGCSPPVSAPASGLGDWLSTAVLTLAR